MQNSNTIGFTKPALAALVVSALAVGGAVGAGVHNAFFANASITTSDGQSYDVMVSPNGASTFVTENGTVHRIDASAGAQGGFAIDGQTRLQSGTSDEE